MIYFINLKKNHVSPVFRRRLEDLSKLQTRLCLGEEFVESDRVKIGSEGRGTIFRQIFDEPKFASAANERLQFPSIHLRTDAHSLPVSSILRQIQAVSYNVVVAVVKTVIRDCFNNQMHELKCNISFKCQYFIQSLFLMPKNLKTSCLMLNAQIYELRMF